MNKTLLIIRIVHELVLLPSVEWRGAVELCFINADGGIEAFAGVVIISGIELVRI